MLLLPSGPLKDAAGFAVPVIQPGKSLLRRQLGAFARVASCCLNLLDTAELHRLLSSVLKKSCFSYFVQFFLVVWCTQGDLVPITVFWQKVKILPANTFLINSYPFKTVGTSGSPVSIWWLHISFFCSSLSLP